MNRPYAWTNLPELLAEASQRLGCDLSDLSVYSWPEVFGSTSGPRGGIGGQSLTTFQVFGFSDQAAGGGLLCCAGIWKVWRHPALMTWKDRP